jgi:hypothetical protein
MKTLIQSIIYARWISAIGGYAVVIAAALCVICSIIHWFTPVKPDKNPRQLNDSEIYLACSRARRRMK